MQATRQRARRVRLASFPIGYNVSLRGRHGDMLRLALVSPSAIIRIERTTRGPLLRLALVSPSAIILREFGCAVSELRLALVSPSAIMSVEMTRDCGALRLALVSPSAIIRVPGKLLIIQKFPGCGDARKASKQLQLVRRAAPSGPGRPSKHRHLLELPIRHRQHVHLPLPGTRPGDIPDPTSTCSRPTQ